MTETNQVEHSPSAEDGALAKEAALKLLAYCCANDWAGYDPYDALNSRLYESLPILHFRLARLVLTQGMKRCPFNLRPLLLVPRTQNPKALALFLSALLKLSELGLLEEQALIWSLAEKLQALRAPDLVYWCWGYSFPWQTRRALVPRGAPNLVCSVFVAEALLDLYEASAEARWLELATSAADYLWHDLYWTEGNSVAGFRYPTPDSRERVHNANFLGAALLCRVYNCSGEGRFLERALKVARYSAGRQNKDGSWTYGELPTQHWVDNFHTGYNLCALHRICRYARNNEFEPNLARGFEFFRTHFLLADGAPKYFCNRAYPLDVHSAAQSIITLFQLKELNPDNVSLAHSVLKWAMTELWDDRGCFFYYQKLAWGRVKTEYMRWGQAWMLLALATLLRDGCEKASGRAFNRTSSSRQAVR